MPQLHKWLLCFVILGYQPILNAEQLQVVGESWPPFIVDGDPIGGSVTEKVRDILKVAKLDYKITLYPWIRSYHIAKTRPNTLIYSIYRSPERESYFHWFCPVHKSSRIYSFKLAKNPADISTLEALKKLTVGVMRGDNSHEFLTNNGFSENKNLDLSADELINIRKLVHGRIDVVTQVQESLEYRLKMLGYGETKIERGVKLHRNENSFHCMALNKNSDAKLVEKIRAAFTLLKNGKASEK